LHGKPAAFGELKVFMKKLEFMPLFQANEQHKALHPDGLSL